MRDGKTERNPENRETADSPSSLPPSLPPFPLYIALNVVIYIHFLLYCVFPPPLFGKS